jgi:hypothetical protein
MTVSYQNKIFVYLGDMKRERRFITPPRDHCRIRWARRA